MAATFLTLFGILVAASVFFCRLILPGRNSRPLAFVHHAASPTSTERTAFALAIEKAAVEDHGVTGLTKAIAEDRLDWLEANGYPSGRVSYVADEGFSVG